MFYSATHLAGWLDIGLTIITIAGMIEAGRRTLWVWLKALYRLFRSVDQTARTLGDVAEGWPALKKSVDDLSATTKATSEKVEALQAQLHGRVLCPLISTIPDPVTPDKTRCEGAVAAD